MSAKKPNAMRYWDALKTPDPAATKPFQRQGGFKGTQIDPTWRLQKMTETFGPIGEGWGYVEDDLQVVNGCVYSKVRVWYIPIGEEPVWGVKEVPNNARWTGPQWGGTPLNKGKAGSQWPDDECFKMSITDALGKCLLQLGLAADVYQGKFDDSKYRDEAAADAADQERQRVYEQDKQTCDDIVEAVSALASNAAIDELIKTNMRAINRVRERNPGLLTRMKAEVEKYRAACPDYQPKETA